MKNFKIFHSPSSVDADSFGYSSNDLLAELNKPRERIITKDKVNRLLYFTDKGDENLYTLSLKNLFYLPTFTPLVIVLIVLLTTNGGDFRNRFQAKNVFYVVQAITNSVNACMVLVFFFAQVIDFFREKLPRFIRKISDFILFHFFFGHIEDTMLLVNAVSQGTSLLAITVGNFCASCYHVFEIEECQPFTERKFPIHIVLYAYVYQLILPIFFKSNNRHVSFSATLLLTGFVLFAYAAGGYAFELFTVLMIIVFLTTIYEFERYKVISFLLSKDALTAEKRKLELSKIKTRENVEKKMNMALLQQILPAKVAEQILTGKQVEPESFDEVTIFFSDVVGFTNICAAVKPIQVVEMLNDLYTVMDYCTSLFPLYKVETIGDAYMVVGGLPVRDKHHAEQVADFALLVSRAVQSVKSPADGTPIRIRIGLHSGPVMAGVVGNLMPRYCLFGDTVNTASRMESNGEAGKIHCSGTITGLLMATNKFNIEKRGDIPIKGKGIMTTYWLESALESNTNSNELAIAKTEVMVSELLGIGMEEEDYDSKDEEEGVDYDVETITFTKAFSFAGSRRASAKRRSAKNNRSSAKFSLEVKPTDCCGVTVQSSASESGVKDTPKTTSTTTMSTAAVAKGDVNGSSRGSQDRSLQLPGSPSKSPKSSGGGSISVGEAALGSARSTSPNRSPRSPRRDSTIGTSPRSGGSFHSRRSVGGAGANGSTGGHSQAMHSIHYNIQHGLNDPTLQVSSAGAKILVVEDSPAQRKILVKRLEKADPSWDVKQASSGEEALAKLKAAKLRFDVVFVDENLSSEDGLFGHELVHVMRDSYNMTTCVIIACTSNPAKATHELLDAGVDYVWPKPPPSADIIKPKIDELLNMRIKKAAEEAKKNQFTTIPES